jgi:hypothetical protein
MRSFSVRGDNSPTFFLLFLTYISGNMQTYRDDCRKANMPRSLPQLLLFMRRGGVVMALPGPKFIARPLGVVLNYVGGLAIGKGLLGYSDTYPEYYDPVRE